MLKGDFVVDSAEHDTKSILATIEQRWNLEPLGSRRRPAGEPRDRFRRPRAPAFHLTIGPVPPPGRTGRGAPPRAGTASVEFPMPVEGHWERIGTPFSRREKRLLGILAGVTAAAAVGIGVYWVVGDSSGHQAGCVDVTVPASVGGATIHRCGKDAVTFCRTQATVHDAIAEACRKQGFATG